MNIKCKIAGLICGINILCFFLLDELKVEIHSVLGQAIGALVFSVPFWILLYLLSKEEHISKHYRAFAKICMKFWVLCYVIVAFGKLVTILM